MTDRWQERAACAGLTWWWDDGRRAAAVRTCASCPVVVDCLVFAFAANVERERIERQDAVDDAAADLAAAVAAHELAPGTVTARRVLDAERQHGAAVRQLEQPPTGHTRADYGTWGGTGVRARRQGAAAWRAGGDTWDEALATHLAWLAAEAENTGRLTAHPWNRTGHEQITHGLPGSYNHCTAGPGGRRCDLCRLGKGMHTDERRHRREGTAA